MSDFQHRARTQRVRAFALRVEIKQMAEDIGYSRPYLTDVLNGRRESEPALERVTEYLDKMEDEEVHALAA